jgi:hypothetical protein
MAAATIDSNHMVLAVPSPVAEVQLSSLTSNQTETIPFPDGAPSGAEVRNVELITVTAATSGYISLAEWASDEANDQFTVKYYISAGGNIANAVIKLRVTWHDQASGGLT